jgi:TonB-dependent receptor
MLIDRTFIRCIFVGALLIVFSLTLFAAGSGNIKGSISDKANGEGLVGANIVVQGTSLGTAADLDGNYQIKLIPAGKWKIKVSCIGYVPITREVTITENETLEENFQLTTQALMGEEVIVTAQARGQVQAINQQLSSDKIANIVSEARIQELPDFNAAQAISRLPGVSTQESSGEASKIVIRGLAPEYNAVAVSGISLASTGSSSQGAVSQTNLSTAGYSNADRSVDLTMVTPYMIKSIEVYKSLTPDINANAIGGYVNMTLREAPSELHGDFMWQSGYTQKTNNYGNFRTIASISDRFFNDKVGAFLFLNAEKYDRDADNMSAGFETTDDRANDTTGWRPVQVTQTTLNRHIETRKRWGGNLILDYKFSTGILRSINMFSRLNSITQDNNTQFSFADNKINYTLREGNGFTDLAMNSLELENDFGFMSMELKVANTYSRNQLEDSHVYQFHQDKCFSGSVPRINKKPEFLSPFISYLNDTVTTLDYINILSSDYKENDQIVKGDFKVPVNPLSILSGYLKFGGEYRHNNNRIDQSAPYGEIKRGNAGTIQRRLYDAIVNNFPVTARSDGFLTAQAFRSLDSKLGSYFLGDKFGRINWTGNADLLDQITTFLSADTSIDAKYAGNQGGGWFRGLYQTMPNDYEYTEKYYAGYLMSQINMGTYFQIVGGVRYEEVRSTFKAYNLKDARNPGSQTADTVYAHPGNHFLLPMVQAKISPVEWFDLRYSYSKTLARPAYTQLSPHITVNFSKTYINASNPDLKPAQSVNHDLIATFHSNELGLLSVGAFYKEIKDFTYSKTYTLYYTQFVPGYLTVRDFPKYLIPSDSGKVTLATVVNSPYTAYVGGYELDLQTRFWYLPFPLDGLLIGANYTHITSKTKIPWTNVKVYGTPRTGIKIVMIDSSRSVRMINQPNVIANAFIGYDYKGFSAKVSFVYQGNSINGYGRFEEQEGYTSDYFRMDFSARQNLPWGLQLFLDVTNLNNRKNESIQASIDGYTAQRYYGMVANFGIRYTYSI